MTRLEAAAELVAYGHHGGMSGLGSTLAHAAVWSVVGRVLWHSPVSVLVVAAGLAVAWFLLGGRRGRD